MHLSSQPRSSSPLPTSLSESTGRRGCWDAKTVSEADCWAGFETSSREGREMLDKDQRNRTHQPRNLKGVERISTTEKILDP